MGMPLLSTRSRFTDAGGYGLDGRWTRWRSGSSGTIADDSGFQK
jgi:hypothetical protein